MGFFEIILSGIGVTIGCMMLIASVVTTDVGKKSDNQKTIIATRLALGFFGIAIIILMAIVFWTDVFMRIMGQQ